MSSLTTPARVRNRFPESCPPDYVMDELIADASAWLEARVGRSISSTDNYYSLARSICTNRTVVLVILRKYGGSETTMAAKYRVLLEQFQVMVTEELNELRRVLP